MSQATTIVQRIAATYGIRSLQECDLRTMVALFFFTSLRQKRRALKAMDELETP
jgi:hypothetical protein